ncbi:MAG: NIPSNAP family protein, partial [Stackebrandtia sp.]
MTKPNEEPWSVVELRQYTLRSGTRDTLIELFDREFVETQEDCGMRVLGQFRDEDDPDRFVWLRAFAGMDARAAALKRFYVDGEAWRTHAPAARETMVDTDNALLLRPFSPFEPPTSRPDGSAAEPPASRLSATIHYLHEPAERGFAGRFERYLRPLLAKTGGAPIAWFGTETAANTFPDLPVRTGEQVFVWFAAFGSAAQRAEHRERLERDPG